MKLRLWKMLKKLTKKVNDIMHTQEEVAAEIKAATEQLKKIGVETGTLLSKIDELKVIIAKGPVSPELHDAVEALTAQAKVVDDLVPDAP